MERSQLYVTDESKHALKESAESASMAAFESVKGACAQRTESDRLIMGRIARALRLAMAADEMGSTFASAHAMRTLRDALEPYRNVWECEDCTS